MEALVIEDNLDKECHALGSLFQHIINEMKVRTEIFLELFFYRYIQVRNCNFVMYDYLVSNTIHCIMIILYSIYTYCCFQVRPGVCMVRQGTQQSFELLVSEIFFLTLASRKTQAKSLVFSHICVKITYVLYSNFDLNLQNTRNILDSNVQYVENNNFDKTTNSIFCFSWND